MSTIVWWRSWHGAPTDNKWLLIASKAKVKPGIVSAVVWALMDYASQHKDRGSVIGFDTEVYAAFSGFDEAEITAVIQAMTDKGVLENGRFVNWEKRQPKREDDSRERVARFREKKRDVTQGNAEKGDETFPSSSLSLSESLSISNPLVKEEDEDEKFLAFRKLIEDETGVTGDGSAAVQAIDEIIEMGATEADIQAGIGWLLSQGKTIKYYSSIVGPTRTEMQKRIQGGNGHAPKMRTLKNERTGEIIQVTE